MNAEYKNRYIYEPFIVCTSVLGACAHGKASRHTSYLDTQEVVRTFTGVFLPPMTDQAQVRAASIVHSTGIVYCQRKSHSGSNNLRLAQLGKHRAGIVQLVAHACT